jgi:hypothetical protein
MLVAIGTLAGCEPIWENTEQTFGLSTETPPGRFARISSPIRTTYSDNGGQPIIAERDLQVRVAAVPRAAVLGANAQAGSWLEELALIIPAGASTSDPFFVRSPEMRLALDMEGPDGLRGTQVLTMDSFSISDDFELGTLQIGPGAWEILQIDETGDQLLVDAQAARKGNYGLRVVDANDNGGVVSRGSEVILRYDLAPHEGDRHFRGWMRVSQLGSVGMSAVLSLVGSQGPGAPGQSLVDLWLNLVDGRIHAAGYDATGYYQDDPLGPVLVEDTWYRVDVSVFGVGTSSGERRLSIDGALVSSAPAQDFSGFIFTEDHLGLPWSEDKRFTGTIDWDDVRTSPQPIPGSE